MFERSWPARKVLHPAYMLATLACTAVPAHAQVTTDVPSPNAPSSDASPPTASPNAPAAAPSPAAPPSEPAANAPASSGIEEVQVTAERRSTDIQKTPLAISNISPDALEKSNVTDLAGLNGLVPGLEITKTSGFENVVTIRGIGLETPENAPTTVPGVALFVDGVYIANTVSLDQTLFDLDHIEVLRGPQGALYGQSATGGAISLVTKQPELGQFGGLATASYGTYNLHREQAEINVPVGSTVAIRASAQQFQHDGFTTDTSFPNLKLDDANDLSGKFAILWKPVDNFSATLTAQAYSADLNGAAQKNILDPNSDPRVVTQDFAPKFDLDTQLYHLNLQWDQPWFSIKSVSAYQSLNNRIKEDSSRSAFDIVGFYDDVAAWNTDLRSYSEELDLMAPPNSRLDWITGVFLLDQHTTQFVAEFEGTTPNPVVAVTPDIETNPPANLAYGNYTNVNRKSYAPFIQTTYHVTNDWRVTLGARYNYDTYDLTAFNFSAFSSGSAFNSYSDHVPTGRFEIDHDLTPQNMVYFSVSRGYKPGGANNITQAAVVQNSFKPETNTAYEIGSKNVINNNLRANFAAFYYVYKNMQYIETDPIPYVSGIANIPSTHIWGGEMELSYRGMGDKLHANANLAVEQGSIEGDYSTIDSMIAQTIEATNPSCLSGGAYYNTACWAAVKAGATKLSGNTPAKMPSVSGSINISYDFRVPNGTFTPRLEYVYRGDMWARIFNDASLDKIKSYGLVNLNLQYVPDNSNFTLSLAATNLTNVAGVNSKYTDPYGTYQTSVQYVPPLQVVGTVSYAF